MNQAPAVVHSDPAAERVVSRYADVQAVLADDRFEVPPATGDGVIGTIAWLRSSVSRFANGAEHRARRARAEGELQRLDPDRLRCAAHRRADELLVANRGTRIDVMARLGRWVPMVTMAAALGFADPEDAARAVIATAAAYFPGANAEAQRAADVSTAQLVAMSRRAELDAIVARIALMVQGCDATAGLIGTALHVLQDGDPQWPTDALLTEVLRHSPPVRASRRVASIELVLDGSLVRAGDPVVCSVDAANRDPAIFERPDRFDPGRQEKQSLTFGYGVRPCPGAAQALALAAGVVDAVRHRCTLLPGTSVEYEPSTALRIPRRLEVAL
jgi:cytochrome P450